MEDKKTNRYDLFKKALNNCQVEFCGEIVSKEKILKTARNFLSNSLKEDKHSSVLFLHTGSILFDAIAFVVCVYVNLIMDEVESAEQNIFTEGMIVTYKGKRWEYLGICQEEYAKGKHMLRGYSTSKECNGMLSSTNYLTNESMGEVIPYYGNSKKLNGMGMGAAKKSKRSDFLRNVIGLDASEISAFSRCVTVIFMDNSELDYLLDNIKLLIKDEEYEITDLVTISYYTNSRELKKKGNPNNIEPAIKVTNSFEKAFELVKGTGEKRVIGFAAFKSDVYKKNALDFERIFDRKKLSFSWLVTNLDYNPWIQSRFEAEGEIHSLALTSRMLKSINIDATKDTLSVYRLSKELEIAKDRKFSSYVIEGGLKWKDYRRIKNKISVILELCLENQSAVSFTRWAYMMLKVFNYAFFPLKELDLILNEPFEDAIVEQKKVVDNMENAIRENAQDVLRYIEEIYYEFYDINPKGEAIKQYVFKQNDKRALFVVPNAKYEKVFRSYADKWMKFKSFTYSVIVESKLKTFDCSSYDSVYLIALMNYEVVNPLGLCSAKNAVTFVYDTQKRLYAKHEKEYREFIKLLNKYCSFKLIEENEDIEYESKHIEESESEVKQDETIRESFMSQFLQLEKYHANEYFESNGHNENIVEAYMLGQFVTGENIIFTKGYISYVLDSAEGTVIEKKVDELQVGDRLVFTVNDDKTKDIVDDLLDELCIHNKKIREDYENVKKWKNNLRLLKNNRFGTYEKLSAYMKANGYSVTGQAIRGWIDEQSHIVGPLDENAYKCIAIITESEGMEADFFKSTNTIRSVRVKLLKLIEQSVVADMNGTTVETDAMFRETLEKVSDIAIVKQLEHIEKIEKFSIQMGRANRPIEL